MSTDENSIIKTQWQAFYGERGIPVAYVLREEGTKFWLRIHSLPESKRYAETAEEEREILRRYNLAGNSVLEENAECVFFYPDYGADQVHALLPGLKGLLFEKYVEPELTLYAAKTHWQNGKFDSLLRLVANDKVCNVSFFNITSREIFAPYDGGSDLFLRTEARQQQLKAQFSSFLSKHPEGL